MRKKFRVIDNEQRKKYDRGFVFVKLEERNREKKCCVDVLNER